MPGRSLLSFLGGLLMTVLVVDPANAQYGNYIVPGSLAETSQRSRETLVRELQNARWRWGPLRVDPHLSIGDIGWIDNIYSTNEQQATGDVRAQPSAGLRASVNLSPKVLVSGFADASYSWWRDQEDLRSLNESLGLQLFGMFNRLQIQLQGGRAESQGNLSSEIEVPVDARQDRIELGFDIDPRGPLLFFGAASANRIRYFGDAAEQQRPDLDVDILDRDTETVSFGVQYELRSGLGIGIGWEQAEGDFEQDPGGRSNKSAGPLLRAAWQGSRLSLDLDAVWREIEFRGRTGRPDYEQLTGVGRARWAFSDRLTASLYGSQQLQFSALDAQLAFEGRRAGLSLARTLGPRRSLRLFYEAGSDEFFDIATDAVRRRDDLTAYGAGFDWQISPRLELGLRFSTARRDSNDPDFERDLTSLTSHLILGGNLLPW